MHRRALNSETGPLASFGLVRGAFLAFLWAGWSALGACAADLPGGAPCATSADCEAAMVCTSGVCIPDAQAGERLRISLQIDPPGLRPDLVPQQVTGIEVRIGHQLPDFALVAPASLDGTVVAAASPGDAPTPLSATITFMSTSGIPGLVYSEQVSSDSDGIFHVRLPPNRYDVTVSPDRADFPPARFTGVTVELGSTRVDLSLPSLASTRTLRGRVVRQDPCTSLIEPLPGARVVGWSPDGMLSTTTATSGEGGWFTLFLPAEMTDVAIRVRQDPAVSGGEPIASVDFASYRLPDTTTLPEVELVAGVWRGVHEYTGRVLDPSRVPVSGVSVALFGAVGAPAPAVAPIGVERAEFSRSSQTGADGRFSLFAPEGEWELAVAPIGTDFALEAVRDVVFGRLGDAPDCSGSLLPPRELEVVLSDRSSRIEAVVSTADGAPVSGALVTAELIDTMGLPISRFPVPASFLSASTTTDDDGRFLLPVENGTYRVSVAPPVSLGLAGTAVLVEPTTGDLPEEIVLPASGAVTGRVVTVYGEPIPGAEIEAWSDDPEPRRVSTGTSGEDGVYTLILPVETAGTTR